MLGKNYSMVEFVSTLRTVRIMQGKDHNKKNAFLTRSLTVYLFGATCSINNLDNESYFFLIIVH